jgi:hypothetical protein
VGIRGKLVIGDTKEVGYGTIDTVGKTLGVRDTSHPLNGLRVIIPSGAYSSSRESRLAYAPITSTTFKNINPISPLITVDAGSGYANKIVTVVVPAKVTKGRFAMGFLYDAAQGRLEGLPLLKIEEDSVTLATRHFSQFFISEIEEKVLMGRSDSGFLPGKDDWQFPNYGTYPEPGGICSGMTTSAMWYYMTKPTTDALNGTWDNNGNGRPKTPGIWQDDSRCWRFASMIQTDTFYGNLLKDAYEAFLSATDPWTWRTIAYAILATGTPQYISVWNTKDDVGHALIAWATDFNKIMVSDPNSPGNKTMEIKLLDGQQFEKYKSGLSKTDIDNGYFIEFNKVNYIGMTAIIDWSAIPGRFSEFQAGTVGNAKPPASGNAGDGTFPNYKIYWYDAKGQRQLLDKNVTPNGKNLKVEVEPVNAEGPFYLTLFQDINRLPWNGSDEPALSSGTVELLPEFNEVKFYVSGLRQDIHQNPVKRAVNVSYASLGVGVTIDPASVTGTPGKDYTFTAILAQPLNGLTYDWSVNNTRVQNNTQNTYTLKNAAANKYTISVTVYDSAKKSLGSATATATIAVAPTPAPPAASNLATLQKFRYLQVELKTSAGTFETVENGKSRTGSGEKKYTVPYMWEGTIVKLPVTWEGTTFKYQRAGDKENFTGTVSPDGNTVLTFNYQCAGTITPFNIKQQLLMTNMPLNWKNAMSYMVSFEETSTSLNKYVKNVEWSSNLTDGTYNQTLLSVNWAAGGSLRFVFMNL